MKKEFKQKTVVAFCEKCQKECKFNEVQLGNDRDGWQLAGEHECLECGTREKLIECDICHRFEEEGFIKQMSEKVVCECCVDRCIT